MNTTPDHTFIPLSPIVHPWISSLLQHGSLLHEMVDKEQSPVNIQSIKPFEENIGKYQEVFEKYGLDYRIYFARKANKCIGFAKAAASLRQGVDTASYNELAQCIEADIPAGQLILTAAIKNEDTLTLAVQHAVHIIIDNLDEYHLLEAIARTQEKEVSISLRIGGFDLHGEVMHSRFGFSKDEAFRLITENVSSHPYIRYEGLHFHLNGYSMEARAAALAQCVLLSDELASQGIETKQLDIGGGFLVNYLESEQEWLTFHRELKRAIRGERPALTYQNDALGIIKIDNVLYGEPTVYPYYNDTYRERFLDAILRSEVSPFTQPLHAVLRERNIQLRIEPGRSLLDQAGITVARVAFRKKDTAGALLVGLEMNRTQMKSSSADFLLDPIHLPTVRKEDDNEPVEGYLVGAYCLEQEFILKRKIVFDSYPEVGDLLVFVNTAGYMMHFFESQAHQFALASNVFCSETLDMRRDDE